MSYSFNKHSSRSRNGTRSYSSSRAPGRRGGGHKKDYINPNKFVQVATPKTEQVYEAIHTFEDFKLHPLLLEAVKKSGFTTPSAVQDMAIPLALSGKDVVGLADTGTGKTAAFLLPILHNLINSSDSRALILAPTRELAQQIESVCVVLSKGSGLRGALLIGGTRMQPQLNDLRRNPRIVIGTPGRVKDHIKQKTLHINRYSLIALDEVDRMLDMGFVADIREILSMTSQKRQLFFFSATLDARVRGIIDEFSDQPVHVAVKTSDASENVHQNVVRYAQVSEKVDKLHDVLIQDIVSKSVVFDDTHRSVEKLCRELQQRGFKVEALHGGKSQAQRARALKKFKDNEVTVLVATDVAARGIDVVDISHVINFSTPRTYNEYVHRIGRAGRAGRVGYALTFIPDDFR